MDHVRGRPSAHQCVHGGNVCGAVLAKGMLLGSNAPDTSVWAYDAKGPAPVFRFRLGVDSIAISETRPIFGN